MRPYLHVTLLVFLAVLLVPIGQADEVQDGYDLTIMKRCILERSMGLNSSKQVTILPKLGNKVGIAIVKIYNGSDLTDPKIVKLYLPLIQFAFQEPRLIKEEEDRKPAVTMLLLNYIHDNIRDAALKNEVSKVEEQVLQQTSKTPTR